MARIAGAIAWFAATCAGVSCGSSAPSSGRPVASQEIGPEGGQVSAAGGRFKIQIPPMALASKVSITIRQVDPTVAGSVGPVFEVGPTGTPFQRQVTLSFSFEGLDLGADTPDGLHVATLAGGKWVPVTSAVDLGTGLVTGQITHLSPWTLINEPIVLPEPDASTDDDGGAGGSGAGGRGGGGAGGQDAAPTPPDDAGVDPDAA